MEKTCFQTAFERFTIYIYILADVDFVSAHRPRLCSNIVRVHSALVQNAIIIDVYNVEANTRQ